MINENYNIAFNFRLDQSNLTVALTAEIEVHHSEIFYVVKNIRTQSQKERSALPDVRIKKANGIWVHCDSGKETTLSMEVGAAIDRYEAGQL